MQRFESSNRDPISAAIEWFEDDFADDLSEQDQYTVYQFLKTDGNAVALMAMKDKRRRGWINYMLADED